MALFTFPSRSADAVPPAATDNVGLNARRAAMINWHIGYTGPWNDPQPRGGVAPSRADLELARHLEKRAAYAAAERDASRITGATVLALGKHLIGFFAAIGQARRTARQA
jgi:hypothetical protein